jgi:chlorobactene glucosyltransferase
VPSGPWTALEGWVTTPWEMDWDAELAVTPSMVAALIFAVVTSILFYRARRHYRKLPLLQAVTPAEKAPNCMVVIPARNEEGVVAAAIQSFPHDTVIVVDDHSTDKTSDEAREAGAGVVLAPPLSTGASGKTNACAAGAKILTSRWILFADADTRYESGFLDSVVQFADDSSLALVSVLLAPQPESVTERLVEPYISALFFSGAGLARDPAALFSGQCILARREAYEFIGGHSAVSKYLAEDVKLALLAARHRLGFAVARAGDLGRARKYTSWKGAWGAIERNAFRLVQVNPRTSLIILLTALSAAMWLPLAVWLWFEGHKIVPGLVALLVLLQLWPWYGTRPRLLLAPLAIYAALPLLLHGLFSVLVAKRVRWKGRQVRAT